MGAIRSMKTVLTVSNITVRLDRPLRLRCLRLSDVDTWRRRRQKEVVEGVRGVGGVGVVGEGREFTVDVEVKRDRTEKS
jgi:hypothetical protein